MDIEVEIEGAIYNRPKTDIFMEYVGGNNEVVKALLQEWQTHRITF